MQSTEENSCVRRNLMFFFFQIFSVLIHRLRTMEYDGFHYVDLYYLTIFEKEVKTIKLIVRLK